MFTIIVYVGLLTLCESVRLNLYKNDSLLNRISLTSVHEEGRRSEHGIAECRGYLE